MKRADAAAAAADAPQVVVVVVAAVAVAGCLGGLPIASCQRCCGGIAPKA